MPMPENLQKRFDFIFDGAQSKRFHTVDTLRAQTIAQHSFGVAWLCVLLSESPASSDLILAALSHDLAEHKVGDVPSPTKRALRETGDALEIHEEGFLRDVNLFYFLTEKEKTILKMADILDGMLFCLRERQLGNSLPHIKEVYSNYLRYAQELPRSATSDLYINHINSKWRELHE